MLTPPDHLIYVACFQTMKFSGTQRSSFRFVMSFVSTRWEPTVQFWSSYAATLFDFYFHFTLIHNVVLVLLTVHICHSIMWKNNQQFGRDNEPLKCTLSSGRSRRIFFFTLQPAMALVLYIMEWKLLKPKSNNKSALVQWQIILSLIWATNAQNLEPVSHRQQLAVPPLITVNHWQHAD